MPEWWTYDLSDLQQFSPRTYYRLFERYNAAIWPVQVAALAGGLWIATLVRRSNVRRGRLVSAILAACWVWVAIAFHVERYATINRIAVYFAWGFAVEAALLVWTGVVRGRLVFGSSGDRIGPAGMGIFLFALAGQPLAGRLLGREWSQVEIFGVAPDPTAVATLGVLLLVTGRVRWELLVVPIAWCVISAATLAAMRSPEAWILAIAALATVSIAIAKTRTRRRPRRA